MDDSGSCKGLIQDYITPRGRCTSGIYCPLGDDILSTTLYKKQNNPMKDIARPVSSACCCGLKEGDVEVSFGTSPPPPYATPTLK